MGRNVRSVATRKPQYNSKLASKFVKCLMGQGKLATAKRVFCRALDRVKKRMPGVNPIEVFTQAVEFAKPHVEIRSKRAGGATYQVPMEVDQSRQYILSIRSIIAAARSKARGAIHLRLADEIMRTYRREGTRTT